MEFFDEILKEIIFGAEDVGSFWQAVWVIFMSFASVCAVLWLLDR